MTVHQAYEIFDESALGAVAGAPEGWRTTLDKLEQEVARIAAAGRSAVHRTFRLERNYARHHGWALRSTSEDPRSP